MTDPILVTVSLAMLVALTGLLPGVDEDVAVGAGICLFVLALVLLGLA